jgi:hypothetical protein
MKKELSGWIVIHRKIQESQGYFAESFCRNMAWIDLLLLANHCDNYFYVRGIKVDVKRGQCGYSEDTLAKRWGWSRGKVRRFLNELEKGQQIVQQKNNITTLLSIVNYDKYQQGGTANNTADGQQTDANKELNNENNINISFDAFWDLYDKKVGDKEKLRKKWVSLTDVERQKIIEYVPKYKVAQPDKQFRKDPAKFFNQKEWNNELVPSGKAPIVPLHPLKPTADQPAAGSKYINKNSFI